MRKLYLDAASRHRGQGYRPYSVTINDITNGHDKNCMRKSCQAAALKNVKCDV